jgi:DegV family protein with EDD domain
MSIKIVADSAADISPSAADAYNITIVPFYIAYNKGDYLKEGIDISSEEFYGSISDGTTVPHTSCPSIGDYTDVFETALNEGDDVICICLSSKLSGSYQAAGNAADILREDYPDRKISVIDSYSATAGESLLVLEAVRMKANGLGFEDIVTNLNTVSQSSGIFFTVDDLMYLQKNGRIGKAAALAGTLLSIKPIIKVEDGELKPVAKVRGRKKAVSSIMSYIKKTVKEPECYRFASIRFFNNPNSENLSSEFKHSVDEINIGATIGTHTGPTAVGIAYIRRYDVSTSEEIKQQKHINSIDKKEEKLRAKIDKLEAKKTQI